MAATTPGQTGVSPGDGEDAASMALGTAFVEAVTARDFAAVEAMFRPDVRFRALTPNALREASTASGARAWIEDWFGDTDHAQPVDSRVDMIADRLHLAYRLQLVEGGAWRMIEQQVFATVASARFADVALVCSGFRPLDGPGRRAVEATSAPRADAFLDAIGRSCATLTPEIRTAVRQLQPGQVLEVVSDDPTAEDGLRSWANLTRNELVDTVTSPGETGRFYIRRGADQPTGGARP